MFKVSILNLHTYYEQTFSSTSESIFCLFEVMLSFCLSDFGVCFLFVRGINVSLWKNTATKFKLKVISTKEMLLENLEVLIQTGKFPKIVYSFVLNNIVDIVDLISRNHYIISHFVRICNSFVEVPLCDRKSTKPPLRWKQDGDVSL